MTQPMPFNQLNFLYGTQMSGWLSCAQIKTIVRGVSKFDDLIPLEGFYNYLSLSLLANSCL